ncbi:flavin monoamine oxidase family protein [Clostridium uliginosum]
MLKIALEKANHIEDFNNIVELLSPPKDITTIASPISCKGLKVGIIGGGLAGLSSAFELRKLGFDITIFEMQEKRIGGRVYTHYFDKDKRFYGELGAMRIPISHETTWHYINLFDLKTRPFIQTNENAFIYVRNKRAKNDSEGKSVMEKIYPDFNLTSWEKNTPWPELIDYALGSNLLKISPDIRKELLQIKKQYSTPIKYFGNLSIREVLEKMGLSEGAIELISSVSPFLGSFYYNSYFESLQEDYSVDSAYRYEIIDGAVNLPLSFYNSLMSKRPKEYYNIEKEDVGKVSWENGQTVTSIFKENNKISLEYTNENSSKTSHQTFDFVICTIPFSSLRNVSVYPMFSTEKMQAIKEVNYTASQKTIFMCNERFWEKGDDKIIGGGSFTDLPITSIWYPNDNIRVNTNHMENKKISNKNKKYNLNDDAGVLLASYNLNQDAIRLGNLDDKTRIEEIKRQVEAVHDLPNGYLDSIVKDFRTVEWNNEKGSLGAFCYFMPNQQNLFSYAMIKPEYNNSVYFAGEHTSLTHGWMQGAVNSGMKVANAIAKYCESM